MIDAIQMMVSSEIANRIDDSSSTAERSICEEDLTRRPWVETDMETVKGRKKQKGRAILGRWARPLGFVIGG